MTTRVLAGAAVIVGTGTVALTWGLIVILQGSMALLEIIAQALEGST
jgi:hypothetical protein